MRNPKRARSQQADLGPLPLKQTMLLNPHKEGPSRTSGQDDEPQKAVVFSKPFDLVLLQWQL